MCGRFNIISDPLTRLIMEIVNGELGSVELETRYNIAPTEPIPVLLKTAEGAWDLKDMRWWLVPFWSDQPSTKYTMFNAKSETLKSTQAFREPFQRRRCIIPASGYYEWSRQGNVKVPYHIAPQDEPGFVFAGLWDRWRGDDQVLDSCAIVTGDAPENMRDIHARIPIALSREEIFQWLDLESSEETLASVLASTLKMPVAITPVSSYVGNSRNKDERCIEPLGETRVVK